MFGIRELLLEISWSHVWGTQKLYNRQVVDSERLPVEPQKPSKVLSILRKSLYRQSEVLGSKPIAERWV